VDSNKEDMPSKSLDGDMMTKVVLISGLLPTHGVRTGEKQVSSELLMETLVLMMPPTDVSLQYPNRLSSKTEVNSSEQIEIKIFKLP